MSIIVGTMVKIAKELLPNLSDFVGVAEESISSQYAAAARRNGGDPYGLDPEAMDGGIIGERSIEKIYCRSELMDMNSRGFLRR